ncbi:MAG: GspH/FimT family pseudopilin [Thauera sp.]|nr:GspH/FimT family pseudopilin [Thauera sp.]
MLNAGGFEACKTLFGTLAMKSNLSFSAARARFVQRAFSLVELMVTVAVLSLLMVLAVPSFTEWIQNSRIRTAAESLQNGLQLARGEAVKRNAGVEFALVGTTGGWVVRLAVGGTVIQQRAGAEGAAGVVVTAAPAGATSVRFDGLGRTNETLASIAIDVPTSALSAARSRDLRITVSRDGAVRMCDPNVTGTDLRSC